jgi:hypothetical protein
VVVTPIIEQPGTPLGTLPPPANISPTAENPVVIPAVVLPTIQPTTQILVPVLMQVTGQVGAPLRADYSGIVVMLTLPNGSALQTITNSTGNFTFANLVPGTYRLDAGVSGYLSSQTTFTLTEGQNVVLPSSMLVGGDTNLDNKIDLTDAAFIAANFDSTSIVAGADLNHDGIVNALDLAIFKQRFGTTDPDADLNGDGIVNALDLAIFKKLFGKAPDAVSVEGLRVGPLGEDLYRLGRLARGEAQASVMHLRVMFGDALSVSCKTWEGRWVKARPVTRNQHQFRYASMIDQSEPYHHRLSESRRSTRVNWIAMAATALLQTSAWAVASSAKNVGIRIRVTIGCSVAEQ